MDPDAPETTTLAFELAALQRVGAPRQAFRSVRRWATNVGIVSDEPTYVVTNFVRKQELQLAFNSGRHGLYESLGVIRSQPEHDAERYVLIGTGDLDRERVEAYNWEFTPIEEAAEEAGWMLVETVDPDEDEDEGDSREGWP